MRGRAFGVDAPACVEVRGEVVRDETARLLDLVHDVRLFHHIPLAVGYRFLQVIRQEFPTDIDSDNSLSQPVMHRA